MATVAEWLAGVTQDGQTLDPIRVETVRKRHATGLPLAKPLPPPNPVKSPGLGDAVSSALSLVGITEERVSAWIGAPCGCSERKKKLNDLGAWAARVLLGERSEPPLE